MAELTKQFSVDVRFNVDKGKHNKGLENRLDRFLKSKGLSVLNEEDGISARTLEYNGVPGNLSLEDLKEKIASRFPTLKVEIEEGANEVDEDMYNYKSLLVFG